MGDRNADTTDIATVHRMITEGGWVDAGAMAQIWGGTPNQPTCRALGSHKATRRDYEVVSSDAMELVHSFTVVQEDTFPSASAHNNPHKNQRETTGALGIRQAAERCI